MLKTWHEKSSQKLYYNSTLNCHLRNSTIAKPTCNVDLQCISTSGRGRAVGTIRHMDKQASFAWCYSVKP
uniref:Uncharacterized protein n=1 Tax=Physcomitrium patens TaxID=3218 RepID=A0A2K1JMD9_PHYPA|nr:hypothetical protein PHYPA_017539 [Physcomitrium patens]